FVPAMTDTMGYLMGRQSGYPSIVENNSSTPEIRRRAEMFAPYFDAANFASRIECPVRIGCGFADTCCAPCAVYAAYNEIDVPDKGIVNGFGMTHTCFPGVYADLDKWAFSEPPRQVEVRVRQTPGGPRLFVDGKRHQPWSVKLGVGGSVPRRFSDTWAQHEIPFVAKQKQDRGMFLFRFERKNSYGVSLPDGWVRIRNFTVVDEEEKVVFPLNTFADEKSFKANWWVPRGTEHLGGAVLESNGVMRVDILNARPKNAEFSNTTRNSDFYVSTKSENFKVRPDGRYRVRFEAVADHPQEFYPTAYQMPGFRSAALEPDPFTETIRLAKGAGVDIVIIMSDTAGCWSREGDLSFKNIDLAFDRAIEANPAALIISRIGVRPTAWMFDQHPDWRTKFFDGRTQDDDSVSCLPWRSHSARFVDVLARHLMARYPRNFAGMHIAAHRAGEWLYEDMLCSKLGGADVHTLGAWRRYLAGLGEPDAATAAILTDREREAKPDGEALPDPVAERRLCEFNRFYSREMADRIAELAAVLRKATDGKKLVIFFYGYNFEVASRGAESGHFALKYLLDKAAPDIDFLGGPFSYSDRKAPDTRPVMAPADTIAKYGVMWWNEDDTRTYLETRPEALQEQGGVPLTKTETLFTLERNVRQNAVRNHGFWWVDLMGRGWYLDPDLWRVMPKVRPLADRLMESDEPFSPDVAMIVSEESTIHRRFDRSWTGGRVIGLTCREIERAGVHTGQYLFEDVVDRDIPARIRFYLNPWHLTQADRAKLRAQRAARPELVRVWLWTPGYLDENGKGIEKVWDAVGFSVRKTTSKRFPRASPLFAVEPDPGDEVWDRYEDGSAAVVARRQSGGGWEIFHAPPIVKPETLRRILSLPKGG
ncbi:MAG TPA: acetylxylan esterase, partial [Opitutales bacterium]|nr:acetylxylan esterase [Opitutales bacterium]